MYVELTLHGNCITEQSKIFYNSLFLLAFLADKHVFLARPDIY